MAGSDPHDMNQGFRDLPKEGWYKAVYIGRSIHRKPLDQTDLKDDVDTTQEAMGNRLSNEGLTGGPQGSDGLHVGLASPTCQCLSLRFGGEPTGVFQCLPTSVMLQNYMISFDKLVPIGGFLDKPC